MVGASFHAFHNFSWKSTVRNAPSQAENQSRVHKNKLIKKAINKICQILKYFSKVYICIFFNLFIFGCTGSSLLCTGFL